MSWSATNLKAGPNIPCTISRFWSKVKGCPGTPCSCEEPSATIAVSQPPSNSVSSRTWPHCTTWRSATASPTRFERMSGCGEKGFARGMACPPGSDDHRTLAGAFATEDAQVALDLRGGTNGLGDVVGKLHRGL